MSARNYIRRTNNNNSDINSRDTLVFFSKLASTGCKGGW